jgi:hypothetical protein
VTSVCDAQAHPRLVHCTTGLATCQRALPRAPPRQVHYTTGPALVTRAFFEGGFLPRVTLLFASSYGPADPSGWGAFGRYGLHLHAGSWKGKSLDAQKLIERAAVHTAHGRHVAAAGAIKRALVHGGLAYDADTRVGGMSVPELWSEYAHSHARAGQPSIAFTELSWDRIGQRQYEHALNDLGRARVLAASSSTAETARVHHVRWLVLANAALYAPDGAVPTILRAADGDGDGGGGDGEDTAGSRAALADAAVHELRTAMRLEPSAASHQLAWAACKLRGSAVHAAEAVPELAHGLLLEESEEHAMPSSDAHAPSTPATPLSVATLLFVWYTAPPLRPAFAAAPRVAQLLRELHTPRHAVGSTRCDLEPRDDTASDAHADEAAMLEPGPARTAVQHAPRPSTLGRPGRDARAAPAATAHAPAPDGGSSAVSAEEIAVRRSWEWQPTQNRVPELAGAVPVDVAAAERAGACARRPTRLPRDLT